MWSTNRVSIFMLLPSLFFSPFCVPTYLPTILPCQRGYTYVERRLLVASRVCPPPQAEFRFLLGSCRSCFPDLVDRWLLSPHCPPPSGSFATRGFGVPVSFVRDDDALLREARGVTLYLALVTGGTLVSVLWSCFFSSYGLPTSAFSEFPSLRLVVRFFRYG